MSDHERLDAWLDGELRRLLNPVAERPAPAPRYRRARVGGRLSLRFASGAGAAFGAKAATGLVVAAFAAGATATAITGTANPADWGTTVEQAVEQCRSTAVSDGIGGCVSAVASQLGETTASAAREERPSPHPARSNASPEPKESGEPTPGSKPGHRPTARPTPRATRSPGADESPRPSASPRRPDPTHSPDSN